MDTIEIKAALHRFMDEEDETFLKMFFEMANAHVSQKRKDRMIAEGEEDVSMGRTHSLKEARE